MSERAWLAEPRALRAEPPLGDDSPFASVVDALCAANERAAGGAVPALLPSRAIVVAIVENLRAVLFPGHFGSPDWAGRGLRYRIGTRLD